MRYYWLLLTPLLFINSVQASQQTTDVKVPNAKELSDKRYEARKKKKQANVSRMYFFVKHIDEVGTPEKAQLDAFLLGLQEAFSVNRFLEKGTFGRSWFCASSSLLNGLNGEKEAEKIIKWVYKNYPEQFNKDSGIYSPSRSVLAYGLQMQYNCGIPQAQIPGFDYAQSPYSNNKNW
jgi:hypothetical protein